MKMVMFQVKTLYCLGIMALQKIKLTSANQEVVLELIMRANYFQASFDASENRTERTILP
jgi:hypothetical protein